MYNQFQNLNSWNFNDEEINEEQYLMTKPKCTIYNAEDPSMCKKCKKTSPGMGEAVYEYIKYTSSKVIKLLHSKLTKGSLIHTIIA